LGPLRDGFPWPPDGPDGSSAWDAEAAMRAMYRRLPPPTARALVERLRPMAPAAGRAPRLPPLEIPRVVVYASDDELFDPASERASAQTLGIDSIEISGGHFPMAEDPDGLAELLDGLPR